MPPPPRMRVATAGTWAVAQDYGASVATAGKVLTSFGPDLPPDWAAGGAGGAIRVNAVVFVDATAPLANQAGTLDHPFRTVQQAITYAVATYTDAAIIRVAPGTYTENLNVPVSTLATLQIEGWGKEIAFSSPLLPTIVGDIVVQPQVDPTPLAICFSNLELQGDISSATPAVDDLVIKMFGVYWHDGAIASNLSAVFLEHTECGENTSITATTLDLNVDGYSWGQLIRNGTTLSPADYSRTFYEEGVDYEDHTLNVLGVAIGASRAVTLNHGTARAGEIGAISKIDVAPATDFQMVFSHTGAATATFILTNISRVSTNFLDDVRTVVWHMDMPTPPAPP